MAIRVHPHDPGISPFLSPVFLCLFLIAVKIPVDCAHDPFMLQKAVHIKMGEQTDGFPHPKLAFGRDVSLALIASGISAVS